MQELLSWYDQHHRRLPWRGSDATRPPAYEVWLAEIMLQQTTVAHIQHRFPAFLKRFPSVQALASAPVEDVLDAWAGLGYYARARNLHTCAQRVVEDFDGVFPHTVELLESLPGIGAYTARAVAAIAYGTPALGVDANVARVLARTARIQDPLPKSMRQLQEIADRWVKNTPDRPGDLTQALFDLGAQLCKIKAPLCSLCPIHQHCAAFAHGDQESYPRKLAKKGKPTRYGAAFVVINDQGEILMQRRPNTGLLGGMAAVPTTDWTENPVVDLESAAPMLGDWTDVGTISHTFTHFHLILSVQVLRLDHHQPINQGPWHNTQGFPTVFAKVVEKALQA